MLTKNYLLTGISRLHTLSFVSKSEPFTNSEILKIRNHSVKRLKQASFFLAPLQCGIQKEGSFFSQAQSLKNCLDDIITLFNSAFIVNENNTVSANLELLSSAKHKLIEAEKAIEHFFDDELSELISIKVA